MERPSYFITQGAVPTTDYVTPNMHCSYVGPHKTKSIMTHALRQTYCDNISKWLERPLVNDIECNGYDQDDTCGGDYEHDYDYGDMDYDVEYDDYEPDKVVQIKDFVDDFYEEITTILYDSGYVLHDLKLFKEDLTYFIYKLSVV